MVLTQPEFKIIAERPGEMVTAAYKNVHIMVWYGNPTVESIDMLDTVTVDRVRECPSGISAIHVVLPSTGLPSNAARDGLVQSGKRWSAHLACVAVVIERKGFWGSAMRGAVTGIQLLAPRTFVSQVHDSIEQAVEWPPPPHLKRTGVQLDPAELLSVIQRVREMRKMESNFPARTV